MKRTGWTKSWRKKWDNPVLRGNPQRIAVWTWIIDHAEWRENETERDQHVIEGVRRPLRLGEICCGRDQIARDTGVSSSGVHKILTRYVSEQMLEQQTYNRFRLLQVRNWDQYQLPEQKPEQKRDNEVTTEEQQGNTTYKEYKNDKNSKNEGNNIRHETKTLYEWIDTRCRELGIGNKTKAKTLDLYVNRYLGRVQFRPALDHYLAWMIDNNKRVLHSSAVGNCFERKFNYNKAQELKVKDWKLAEKDLQVRAQLKGQTHPEEVLQNEQSVEHFIASQQPT